MRRFIEGSSLSALGLLLACSAPPPDPPTTPLTAAELRAALTDGADLPSRATVQAEGGQLDLSRIPLEDRHAAVLRQVDFSAVRELDLSGTDITPGAVRGLCGAPGLDQIDRLTIDCYGEMVEETPSFTESAVAIASCPALMDLEALLLLMCSTGDAAASAIARAPWTALRTLHMPANDLGPLGVKALAESRSLGRLDLLRLDHNEIGADGFRALLDGGVVARATVELNHCKLDDASGQALLEAAQVHQLQFTGNPISEETAAAITEQFGASVEVD